jgi:uncharacterized protein (TIGR03663 family)
MTGRPLEREDLHGHGPLMTDPSNPGPFARFAGLDCTLTACLLVSLLVGLGLRFPQLDRRPMHNDEAVNAVKFGKLWETGRYTYDPNEHHGPSLFYSTLAIARLTSSPDFEHLTETKLRLVTVCFGLGLIALLPLLADGLGRNATIWAGLFTAVSPAMVFYSRYYIHEMLLVFFTLLALAAGWRYWRSRRLRWALLAGAAIGLMQTTKETFIIALGAAALALGLNQVWNRLLDASGVPIRKPTLKLAHAAAAAGLWLLVAIVLFSSFLSNASGPLDSILTYAPWLRRAGGESPHIHSWSFYLQRLLFFHQPKGPIWSEATLLVLAIIGAGAAFKRQGLKDANSSFIRFLALYSFLLMAAYSLISYKTPWCLLGFWNGTILVAGVGAAVLIQGLKRRSAKITSVLVVLATVGQLGVMAWKASVDDASDPGTPYVYAQTSQDILNLVKKIEMVSTAHPDGHNMLVKVMAPEDDYWPLPWYLRAFRNTGWWSSVPAEPYAPVMVVSSRFRAELDKAQTHQMVGIFQLRPQVFFEMYVEVKLWRAWLAANPPRED